MPTDSKSRSRLANNLRSQLLNMLGNCCEECGSEAELEINHIFRTKTYKSSHLSHYNRQRRYLKEAEAGLLNILCKSCNAAYRPKEVPAAMDTANCPF